MERPHDDLETTTLHVPMVIHAVTPTVGTLHTNLMTTTATGPDDTDVDPALRPRGRRRRGELMAGDASGPK